MSDFSGVELERATQSTGESALGRPWIASSEAIRRCFRLGQGEYVEELKIVGECRAAMAGMPRGKRGLVLGSGFNTELWEKRGWDTLDISPRYGPHFVADANWLEGLGLGSYDFIYAECITFDASGENGVNPARLLNQANKALKTGGKLIIETAHVEGVEKSEKSVPDRRRYANLMVAHGFKTIVELGMIWNGGEVKEQRAVYYGEKRAEGYDQSRIEGFKR